MWNKLTKFISENFRIVATLVTVSIITFINEGFVSGFSMQKFTDSGFAGFSLENALEGTLTAYLYLFEGLSILGALIVIMWRVIAGYWIWNIKDHTKNVRKQSDEEFTENNTQAFNYIMKLALIASLVTGVFVIIIGLTLKFYIHYKTGSW